MTNNEKKIGLLAGNGLFPLCFARGARANGIKVVAIAIKGECDPALEELVDQIHWTGIGRLGKWIKIFKSEDITDAVMCGGVEKARMYPNVLHNLPDARALKLWFSNSSRQDHDLLGSLADEFGKEGITIRSSVLYCPQLLAPEGNLTASRPTEEQWADIQFGWPLIKKIAAMQIGQTMTVKDRAVIAVEGIDGTDAALRRSGKIAGRGMVAIKVAKKEHDPRFDIPCIGPETIDILKESSAAVLAIEAGATLLLDAEETIRKADKSKIALVALKEQGPEERTGRINSGVQDESRS